VILVTEKAEDGRVIIPLRMIDGNLDALLKHEIECHSISLKRDPLSANGVLLLIHQTEEQRKRNRKLGFQTRASREKD
jgi:hypothetical protein